MKRSKEELLKLVSEFVGDMPTDEALSLLEDISDTVESDTENWKQKYIDNDKAWRERYKARFSSTKEEIEEQEEQENDDTPLTYESLFEEVKKKK